MLHSLADGECECSPFLSSVGECWCSLVFRFAAALFPPRTRLSRVRLALPETFLFLGILEKRFPAPFLVLRRKQGCVVVRVESAPFV
jgi:hypothetical protein